MSTNAIRRAQTDDEQGHNSTRFIAVDLAGNHGERQRAESQQNSQKSKTIEMARARVEALRYIPCGGANEECAYDEVEDKHRAPRPDPHENTTDHRTKRQGET